MADSIMGQAVLCRSGGFYRLATPLVGLVLVAGCTSLPGADGTEAALIDKAQGLPALVSTEGRDARSVARNGLLLSPSVREAASLVSASADEVRVQRGVLFPQLGLRLGGGVGDAGDGDPALALEGMQRLFDFGDSKRAIGVADLDLQINYIAFHKTVDEALVELLNAYDSVRMYGELLDVHRDQLAAMRSLETLVANRTETGAASSSDLLETRKRLQSAAFLVNDIELALGEARDRLVRLSGQARGGRVNMAGRACAAAEDTDDMRIARLRLARAKLTLERAEKARMPRLVLSPIARSELGDGGMSVGLNLGIQSDFLQGGALTAKANAARNGYAAAQAGVEAVELNDALEERRLRRSLAAGNRKAEMLRQQIDLLSQTRKLYRSQYFDLGTRQISDLLDNEEEYYGRQAELVELSSTLAADRVHCAARNRTLRREIGVEGHSLYGFPLAPDAI